MEEDIVAHHTLHVHTWPGEAPSQIYNGKLRIKNGFLTTHPNKMYDFKMQPKCHLHTMPCQSIQPLWTCVSVKPVEHALFEYMSISCSSSSRRRCQDV
jgi:hypothetical protein